MVKTAKQLADILNTAENKKDKDVAERKEKRIKTKLDKKNKNGTTMEIRKKKKRVTNKEQENKN